MDRKMCDLRLFTGYGFCALSLAIALVMVPASGVLGAAGEKAVKRDYVTAPVAPASQSVPG